MPIETIISALIKAGGAVAGGVLSASSQRDANRKNLELASLERADTLKQRAIENKQAAQSLSLSRKGLEFQQSEAALNRKERTEERGYERLQNAADRFAEYLNQKNSMVANRLNPLMRGR
jgi:Skp family chaperone for outer membrane proteins